MHLAPIIRDLAIILGIAALVTYVFRLIKQPVVLGYIVAGLIVGPYAPPVLSVVDLESVKVWADLGVIFLMFALGLEFSFRRLVKVGFSAGATAVLQIVTMIVLGYACGRLIGWSAIDAVFLGCMVSISSTTIILKAFDEMGIKTRRFVDFVFGILIVEDLAAIIMLVALSNIATRGSLSGVDLLIAGAKLTLVVGAWLIIGMFIVPRFVKAVSRKGNDEMMIVVSLGLCLALVSFSAYFRYSVALGAFIMGSIIAETSEAHRIEKLVAPLKDIFGAVFFVSVGMLLDPSVILVNVGPILVICAVVILGMIVSVSLGALATGQTLATAIQSGLSMAQIGEFSFIIATLGLTYDAIGRQLYPIIVAVSLITTFTTPYFIKIAPSATRWVERSLPDSVRSLLDRYVTWLQRSSPVRNLERSSYVRLLRWLANAIVVVTIFVLSADQLIPWLEQQVPDGNYARAFAWVLTFVAASPFIWAMLTTYRLGSPSGVQGSQEKRGRRDSSLAGGALLLSRLATVFTVGLLSLEYFALWVALVVTVGVAGIVFIAFRRQIEGYYRWFEETFVSGIASRGQEGGGAKGHNHLVPWDAHLVEIAVDPLSGLVGKTLIELQLRERFGMNVVVIKRPSEDIVAPKATERLYPGDVLLCFGTDQEIEKFRLDMEHSRAGRSGPRTVTGFSLIQVEVGLRSTVAGRTIRDSGIREEFDAMVVGIERDGQRIQSPKSDMSLNGRDLVWVVGETERLHKLRERFRRVEEPSGTFPRASEADASSADLH